MLIALLSVDPHRPEFDRARLLGVHERSGPGSRAAGRRESVRRPPFQSRDRERQPLYGYEGYSGERRSPAGASPSSSASAPSRARYGERFRRSSSEHERSFRPAGGAPASETGGDSSPARHRPRPPPRSGVAHPAFSRKPRARTGSSPPGKGPLHPSTPSLTPKSS